MQVIAQRAARLALAVVALMPPGPGHAQESKYDGHQRTSFYVAVRDGTKLAVDLFQPTTKGVLATGKLPVVWMHTPYNRRTYRNGGTAAVYPGFALQLVQHGYHVAVVDFRGVHASFGQNRAYNRGEWLDAARMDAYDITEWFARQPWSNGRIGMWGCSATGGSQMQAATTAPPSLKAIFPMSAEFDAYSFQVNGGVAPVPGAPLRALPGPSVRDKAALAVDGPDGDTQLQAAIAGHLQDGDAIGDVPFRNSVSRPLGETWWLKSSLRFFDYWLKGSRNGLMDEPAVTYYTYNAPREQAWRRATSWPLPNEVRTTFYLGEGTLTRDKPADAARDAVGFNRLTEPATSTTGPRETANDNTLFYQTPALTTDVEVTGHPAMHLWMAADAPDADIVARLDDVAPDGSVRSYNMHGQFRASRRARATAPYDNFGLPWHSHKSAEAQALVPGAAVEVEFEMLPMSYIFKAGHRLRLTLFFPDPEWMVQKKGMR